MKLDELEKRLDYRERFGFIKETGDPDVLAWVLLSKRKPAPITPFDPTHDQERFLKWTMQAEALRRKPYFIAVIEQQRDVYETAEYESTEEFGQKENHSFASLQEAVTFLLGLGFNIDNIKRASEIGAP